jgi:cytochrome c553
VRHSILAAASCALVVLGVAAAALPEWAYPLDPAQTPTDAVRQLRLPGSERSYTFAQVDDPFNAPDWYPTDYPPMPDVVAHGRMPNVQACGHCHLASGAGRPETASLYALPTAYVLRQLNEFKSGARHGALAGKMSLIANSMSADDFGAAAAYFAKIKKAVPYKVVETETVQQSYLANEALRLPVKGAATEPLGGRIVELPLNTDRALSRDPRSGFVAYVPVGSIAKGDALVSKWGCGYCHGLNFKGLNDVPTIAGKSPVYVYRQLNDMKTGSRAGAMASLMKDLVGNLSDEDMIAISAFLGSRQP